jgi:DNA repair exonuclease SbcCD ATPase subunit
MSKNEELSASVTSSTDSLLQRARQVSGNNLKGSVKIVSQAELNILIKDMVAANAGADEAELQALRQQWEQEEAARVHKLQEKHDERERELQEEIRQMQMQLASAESNQKEAIASAQAAANAKIAELQHIIDSDDARARLAFLEKEVARLQALVDRYAQGLEAITAVDLPELADEESRATSLAGKASGDLADRITYLGKTITLLHGTITKTITDVNDKDLGTLYTCFDLIESTVSLRHLRHELRSLEAALG